MKLPKPVRFEWDEGNIEKNWKKHKIHYKETEEAFLNKPIRIFRDIKHSQGEIRYTILGKTNEDKMLYITFTIRDKKIRVISARNQNSKEKKLYEKK